MVSGKLLIAASTDANMRYASGLRVPDPFILLDTGRRKYALLSSLEYGRAKREAPPGVVPVLLDPYYAKVKGKNSLGKILAIFLKEKKVGSVTMARNAWAGHVEGLWKQGVKVQLAEQHLYPERAVKNAQELRHIKKVRDATVEALDHVLSILKKSSVNGRKELVYKRERVTSEFLKMEARMVLLQHACEAKDIIISHGTQTALPHDMGSGVLKAHEPIILDFFPRSMESGYWFDMTRTVCKGRPSTKFYHQRNAVRAAKQAALAKVKAGVSCRTVHRTAVKVLERAGYSTTSEEGFIHSTGHGVGLEIHESPSLGEKSEERLKAGNIITIEPGLYYKGTGGARLEDTVLVTTTGYRDLTRYEQRLIL